MPSRGGEAPSRRLLCWRPEGRGGRIRCSVLSRAGGTLVSALPSEDVHAHDSIHAHAPLSCFLSSRRLFMNNDFVFAIQLRQTHFDKLVPPRRQVLSDIIGPDRQLAVASVYQNGKLGDGRAA